jgi:RNA polymerase-binding protein DksA
VRARDLERFERQLLEEKERVASELEKLEGSARRTLRDSSGDLSAYAFHMADVATDAMTREQNFMLAAKLSRTLGEIEGALERVRSRSYGVCNDCGKQIGQKRLKALPYARLCLGCQEVADQGRGPAGAGRP